jgi:GNAT superfamily N-acetyltransferase
MEKNEWAFCSLWAKEIFRLRYGVALVNPRLAGDYFFNRATIENNDDSNYEDETNHVSQSTAYKNLAKIFWKEKMDCYLYFVSKNPSLQGLKVIDTMQVLRSTGEIEHFKTKVQVAAKPEDISAWVDIFCRSFSVPIWQDEVTRIITSKINKLALLLAYRGNIASGCAAIFTHSQVSGLYCLGTVPEQRNKGVAKSILNYAKFFAKKQNSIFLFLQTLESEKLVDMYKRSGFEVKYTKTICTMPRPL